MDSDASKHVQAYLEYNAIVGNADGGKMMNDKEFEEFKDGIREKRKHRLYAKWRNADGVDCKSIGPAN